MTLFSSVSVTSSRVSSADSDNAPKEFRGLQWGQTKKFILSCSKAVRRRSSPEKVKLIFPIEPKPSVKDLLKKHISDREKLCLHFKVLSILLFFRNFDNFIKTHPKNSWKFVYIKVAQYISPFNLTNFPRFCNVALFDNFIRNRQKIGKVSLHFIIKMTN